MDIVKKKQVRRQRIKLGIRKKIKGNTQRPRLTVYRSNNEIYAQIIDDSVGRTLLTASSIEKDMDKKNKNKTEIAIIVGKRIAEKALENKIESVVFDRNAYLFHGRVKALADAAREGGLKF
jgi:large subunit ribosomal protein L18